MSDGVSENDEIYSQIPLVWRNFEIVYIYLIILKKIEDTTPEFLGAGNLCGGCKVLRGFDATYLVILSCF